jgi:hypothetical protein
VRPPLALLSRDFVVAGMIDAGSTGMRFARTLSFSSSEKQLFRINIEREDVPRFVEHFA